MSENTMTDEVATDKQIADWVRKRSGSWTHLAYDEAGMVERFYPCALRGLAGLPGADKIRIRAEKPTLGEIDRLTAEVAALRDALRECLGPYATLADCQLNDKLRRLRAMLADPRPSDGEA